MTIAMRESASDGGDGVIHHGSTQEGRTGGTGRLDHQEMQTHEDGLWKASGYRGRQVWALRKRDSQG